MFMKFIQKPPSKQRVVHHSQEEQHYTVLLIITDGVVNDLDNTKVGAVIAYCYHTVSLTNQLVPYRLR
jgi:hypothetical protein